MDIRKLDDRLSVAPQITPAEVTEAAALGFRAIICNRPDGEAPGQPTFEEIERAAKAAGLEARLIPVASGGLPPTQAVAEMARALDELPGPVLAFCRSGTRSTILWALAQAGRRPAAQIVAAAREAGYDIAPLAPLLETAA
ncbi:sulfide:quinone oxidoreductase [Meinhardsimonia xiamenensis]|jgi:sulfide:quinone oxidoreductase|uniref:Sulfide:quinone oxidoreductase n=1 Tax=Meinhardsimonia xiamenensis TaxID=990712 RepID=A0A1G9D346_9RHOB|nr:TIGR01244 family sulfur transferase [Meinhardsimonia xiamenensis]PRX38146.1 sulfide:quinone oxidoreductase [Meinhardsimonia xiamenensis]SDK58350.1 sulfide:quinone oxidoreductase [Meinhardsimonia xiamenensis]